MLSRLGLIAPRRSGWFVEFLEGRVLRVFAVEQAVRVSPVLGASGFPSFPLAHAGLRVGRVDAGESNVRSSCSTARAWAGVVVARVARMVTVVPVVPSTSTAAEGSRSRVIADASVMSAVHTCFSVGHDQKVMQPRQESSIAGCGRT